MKILTSTNVKEINKFVVDNILIAANLCIPKKRDNKAKCLKIPKYMRKLIKHRRYLNKNKNKSENREELNFRTKVIRVELKVINTKNGLILQII